MTDFEAFESDVRLLLGPRLESRRREGVDARLVEQRCESLRAHLPLVDVDLHVGHAVEHAQGRAQGPALLGDPAERERSGGVGIGAGCGADRR